MIENIVTILNSIAIIIGSIFFYNWVPKYFQQKAKNLANKEDLEELTTITEDVRRRFERDTLVFRSQFEAEFDRLQGCWTRSRRLHRAFIAAFPHPNFAQPNEENFKDFVECHVDFLDYLEGSIPFISEDVYSAFDNYENFMTDMKIRGLMPLATSEVVRYRDEAKSISELIGKRIRSRISQLRIIQ